MPKAMKITEDIVALVVENAKLTGFDLSYLFDEIEDHTAYGWDTYLITDGKDETHNVTFTAKNSADFNKIWIFANGETTNQFAEITRK